MTPPPSAALTGIKAPERSQEAGLKPVVLQPGPRVTPSSRSWEDSSPSHTLPRTTLRGHWQAHQSPTALQEPPNDLCTCACCCLRPPRALQHRPPRPHAVRGPRARIPELGDGSEQRVVPSVSAHSPGGPPRARWTERPLRTWRRGTGLSSPAWLSAQRQEGRSWEEAERGWRRPSGPPRVAVPSPERLAVSRVPAPTPPSWPQTGPPTLFSPTAPLWAHPSHCARPPLPHLLPSPTVCRLWVGGQRWIHLTPQQVGQGTSASLDPSPSPAPGLSRSWRTEDSRGFLAAHMPTTHRGPVPETTQRVLACSPCTLPASAPRSQSPESLSPLGEPARTSQPRPPASPSRGQSWAGPRAVAWRQHLGQGRAWGRRQAPREGQGVLISTPAEEGRQPDGLPCGGGQRGCTCPSAEGRGRRSPRPRRSPLETPRPPPTSSKGTFVLSRRCPPPWDELSCPHKGSSRHEMCPPSKPTLMWLSVSG